VSTPQEFSELLAEWHATLVDVLAVYGPVNAALRQRTTRLLEELVAHGNRSVGVLGCQPLPEEVVLPQTDRREAIANGERAFARLVALRQRANTMFLEAAPTPGTVEFIRGMAQQTRQLGRLYTSLRSHETALHSHQFAARVPHEYALTVTSHSISPENIRPVLAALTCLYESGVPAEYILTVIDPDSLDVERAERVTSAYREGLPAEYAGVMV
jgi:hypothetical protein